MKLYIDVVNDLWMCTKKDNIKCQGRSLFVQGEYILLNLI